MHWSIYCWIDSDTAASSHMADLCTFATDLGTFLSALQRIDSADGPLLGLHSFYRGGHLSIYDSEVKEACEVLKAKIDTEAVKEYGKKLLAQNGSKCPFGFMEI